MPSEKNKFEYKIENVVATVTCDVTEKVDLKIIAHKFEDVEYNPDRFPGVIMRLKKPKATILIFTTGKMVMTGLQDASEAPEIVKNVINRIQKCKIKMNNPRLIIQNIVASGDLKFVVDLNMTVSLMENCMYEPEVFPGLIYRMSEPHIVFLIFSTGRIVITAAKTKEVIKIAIQKLIDQLHEQGLDNTPSEVDDFVEPINDPENIFRNVNSRS